MSMKLVKKGGAPHPDDAAAIAAVPSYPWDGAMAMLATGEYDVVGNPRDGRGPDQPGAQSPAPGTDPANGKETAAEGQMLTNVVPTAATNAVTGGLPTSPVPAKNDAPQPPKVMQPPKADGK